MRLLRNLFCYHKTISTNKHLKDYRLYYFFPKTKCIHRNNIHRILWYPTYVDKNIFWLQTHLWFFFTSHKAKSCARVENSAKVTTRLHWSCLAFGQLLVKGLWLCLWELWHSDITLVLITECHNSHKHRVLWLDKYAYNFCLKAHQFKSLVRLLGNFYL